MTRQNHLDVLRIIAICAVVVIHVAVPYLTVSEIGSPAWQAANISDSLCRWAVPVFIMISGALFLDPERDQPLKKLWTNNIARMLVLLVFWNIVYALIYAFPSSSSDASLYDFARALVLGDVHMWFLYMIIGLYIVTPFLRLITASEQLTNYFLVLAFLLNTLIPFACGFGHGGLIGEAVDMTMIQIPIGFSFYFVLGYKINSTSLDRRWAVVAFVLAIAGVAACATLTSIESIAQDQLVETYFDYFSMPTCITSASVFTFAKMCAHPDSTRRHRLTRLLSKATLGVYLIHVIVIRALMTYNMGLLIADPVLALIATAALSIVISFALSLLINLIPFVNKHLV